MRMRTRALLTALFLLKSKAGPMEAVGGAYAIRSRRRVGIGDWLISEAMYHYYRLELL